MEALMRMQQEDDEDKGIEFKIEEERAKLVPDKWTKVNKETFEAWHKKRREKRLKKKKEQDLEDRYTVKGKGSKAVFLSGRALMKYDASMFKNDEDSGEDEEEDKEERKGEEGDEDIIELRFGIDEEEEELDREIEKARKLNVDKDLFQDDDADDVDLDDLE